MNVTPVSKVLPFRPRNAGVEKVVYWVNQSGYMMMAPHTEAKPLPGFNRVELTSVSEIEQFSRRFSKQETDKIKNLKVEEHLRQIKKREQMRYAARLRIAQGYSLADVEMNKHIIESIDRQDAALFRLIAEDSSMVTGCLEIEKHEQPTGAAQYGKKKVALA